MKIRIIKPIRAASETRSSRPLRKMSELKPDDRFLLKGGAANQGFLFFQSNLFRRTPNGGVKPAEFWMHVIGQLLYPDAPKESVAAHKVVRGSFKLQLQNYLEYWRENVPATHHLQIRPLGDGYLVRVLVYAALKGPATGWPLTKAMNSGRKANELLQNDRIEPAFVPTSITNVAAKLSATGMISSAALRAFSDAQVSLDFIDEPGKNWVFANFVASKAQIEFLTSSPWLEVRPSDVFNVILPWVKNDFGMLGPTPRFSIPLARIARGVDPTAPPRTDENSVCVTHQGDLLYLPTGLNDTAVFDTDQSTRLERGDGSYGLLTAEGLPKPPSRPMPLLVDWTNFKFAYSIDNGSLAVMDLSRVQPARTHHYLAFLDKTLVDDDFANLYSLVSGLSAEIGRPLRLDYPTFIRTVGRAATRREELDYTEYKLRFLGEYAKKLEDYDGNVIPEHQEIVDFLATCDDVLALLRTSPANAFQRYSVLNVYTLLGQLTAMSMVRRARELKDKDAYERAVYEFQGVDPEAKLEDLPYVNEGRGLLPHQDKVVNITRNMPENAIYPVQAGGGKTTIGIVDVLRFLKRSSDLPLVMCPAHLVPQYVKEFSYFTGSRINVISITTATVRSQKLDRLKVLLAKSPRNTVVVVDYDVVKLRSRRIAYGSDLVNVYPIVEFLRQFKFGFVLCDESHKLKNAGAVFTDATVALISPIPVKRLASGTMVANTLTDLASQIAIMDPTVFGSKDDFIKKYALEVKGDKVLAWKPGAELLIKKTLQSRVVVAEAKRKEWAAILPARVERFHTGMANGDPIQLTPKQREVYDMIIQEAMERITQEAMVNESLAKLLRGEVDPTESEDATIDIDSLLRPYCARMERFLTAPGEDPIGKTVLSGEDLVSAKVLKVIEIIREHIDQGISGKILIFCNYEAEREGVFNALPPDLQARFLNYHASAKVEHIARFEKDDNVIGLVGIDVSLNTGLNLQRASRLIRISSVFTPAALEQGDSRIGRPNVKEAENRAKIYFDTIVVNRTVDVAKMCYLMSKSITVAKYEEAGNQRFDQLETPVLFPLTMDNIFKASDLGASMLDYFKKYQAFRQAVQAEYDEYRALNKDRLFVRNPDGSVKLKVEPITRGPNLEGSAMMLRLPYVPGLELYQAEDLGLIRYDEYLDLDTKELEASAAAEGEDSESDSTEAEEAAEEASLDEIRKAALAKERAKAIGLGVHTDRGDGTIVRVSKNAVRVELAGGEKRTFHKLSVFVITRASTSGKDVRTQLLKADGLVPADTPIEVKELEPIMTDRKARQMAVEEERKRKAEEVRVKEEQATSSVSLGFTVFNDFIGLRLTNSEDPSAVAIAQRFGFKFSPAYYYARIRNAIQLQRLVQLWAAGEMTMDEENSRKLRDVYLRLKSAPTGQFFGVAKALDISTFFRVGLKPNPDPMHVEAFPLIQDEQLYVALPKTGHPGSKTAIRLARPMGGLQWFVMDANAELMFLATNKPRISKLIQDMLHAGVTISNLGLLKSDFRQLRVARQTSKD